MEKAKESRFGGGNGIGSRAGGGNGIGKEVDRTRGGIGDEYTDQDEGKGRRIEEGGRNGGGSDSSEEFGGMVGMLGMRVEGNGVSQLNIFQALMLERRQYVNLMCKYPLSWKFPPKPSSSPSDRSRVELCRFGESRCFAGLRCFGCLSSPGRCDKSSRIRGMSAYNRSDKQQQR